MSDMLYVLTPDEYAFVISHPGIKTAATKFTVPAADAVVSAFKTGPALWRIDVTHAEEPFDEVLAPEYVTGDVQLALAGLLAAQKKWIMSD